MKKSIKLTELLSSKLRIVIPIYSNGEEIAKIEIYNLNKEQSIEIKNCLQEGQVNNDLRLRLLKENTNIDVDVEITDDFDKYYSDIFERVLVEIDSMILEVALNYTIELDAINNLPKDKIENINNFITKSEDLYIKAEEELEKIKEEEEFKKQKIEIQRQIEELNNKLNNLS